MCQCHLHTQFSPGSSRQPRSGHAPQPVTPSGVPHIRVSSSVLYLLGGPGADSTLTTTLTPTELGPAQANPGTSHQGVLPRHAFMVRRVPPAREFVLLTFCCAVDLGSPHCPLPQRSCPTIQHTSLILYTRHVLPHIFTLPHKLSTKHPVCNEHDTQQRPPCAHYTQHTHRVHECRTTSQMHSSLCPMTTTQDAGVGGWSFAISRESCIPDVAALFRWSGVSPDPGRLLPQEKNPVGRLPPTTSH